MGSDPFIRGARLFDSLNLRDPFRQESFQILRQWRREVQVIAAVVRKSDRLRVQEQPLQAKFLRLPILFLVAITFITR